MEVLERINWSGDLLLLMEVILTEDRFVHNGLRTVHLPPATMLAEGVTLSVVLFYDALQCVPPVVVLQEYPSIIVLLEGYPLARLHSAIASLKALSGTVP